MHDYYKTLGVSSAATSEEIRRAFRILARRYHPDVNPDRGTTSRFQEISQAYEVLSEPESRKQYDQERDLKETFSSAFDRAHHAYQKQQDSVKQGASAKRPSQQQAKPPPKPHQSPDQKANSAQKKQEPLRGADGKQRPSSARPPQKISNFTQKLKGSLSKARKILSRASAKKDTTPAIRSLSILEVSITVFEAISGVRKSVEVSEKEGQVRKISVSVPAGVRQGSVVRFQSKEDQTEEVIVVIRVAHHPWLSVTHRGLTMQIPLTLSEAMLGAKVQIPSLGDPLLVTVEPGTQSGDEVRLKGQGIHLSDGTRGDLFVRFMIKAPIVQGCAAINESDLAGASVTEPNVKQSCAAVEALYETPVRAALPKAIMEEEKTS